MDADKCLEHLTVSPKEPQNQKFSHAQAKKFLEKSFLHNVLFYEVR